MRILMILKLGLVVSLFINTAFAQDKPLKTIKPTFGYTPDISVAGEKNFQRLKRMYAEVASIINSHKDFETAKKRLSAEQIRIWENEEDYDKDDHLDISYRGCSWYCGGGPDSIFATSSLKSGTQSDYKADNAHDFSLRTAWIEGASGYGIGESITYRFAKGSPPINSVEIFNGYMKTEQAWKDNARVKKLKLYINDKPFAYLALADSKTQQLFKIGLQQGIDKDLYLRFEIVEVYKGNKYDDVAISEIEFDGEGVH